MRCRHASSAPPAGRGGAEGPPGNSCVTADAGGKRCVPAPSKPNPTRLPRLASRLKVGAETDGAETDEAADDGEVSVIELQFLGAAQAVTGSKHLLRTSRASVLLDCGLFQGRRRDTLQKNRDMPLDVQDLDAVVLSHAHIDHSGALPLL